MKHAARLQTRTIDPLGRRFSPIELTDEPAVARRRGLPTIFSGLLLIIAMLAGLATVGHAQCAVANPSFEEVNVSQLPAPGWGAAPSSETPIPGLPGWYTRERSPDIFWPSSHVPNNFMTASPLFAFHGKNYAGISAGRFSAGYLKESLAGTLNFSPVGAPYEVRARFAMGTVRNTPMHVQVFLDGPSGPFWVGHTVVNNANWTLFSRIINIPSGNYNRIVIAGVDSMPRYTGGYVYIDSVDICRVDVCDYLRAGIKFNSSANGKCCFDLYVNNSVPSTIQPAFGVRVRPDAPVTIINATSASGWAHTANFPTDVTWRDAAGLVPLPTGSSMLAGTYCIQANGAMPQRHVIEFLDRRGDVICRDTAYSECDSKIPDCFRFLETKVDCGQIGPDGVSQGYSVSFIAVNNSGVPGTLTFSSPYGIVSPSTFAVGPGTTPISLTFIDTPPADKAVCLYATLTTQQNGQITVICRDSVCFELPQCHEGCCDKFLKRIESKLKYVNGTVGLNGCALAGPGQIKRFSATIVAASTRRVCGTVAGAWTPVFGDITNAALGAALPGPYFITNPPFSREVVWGGMSNPNCLSFNPCVPFKLQMQFPNPPAPLHGCRDTLRFSVRYSFTDCECRTCDTVITYTIVRKGTLVPWDGGIGHVELGHGRTAKDQDGSERLSAVESSELLKLTMINADKGTLRVALPAADPSDTPIRIVGMSFRPQEVALVSLVERGTGRSATISGNVADAAFDLAPGAATEFDVTYSNSDGLTAIGNSVKFRFVSVDDPSDTLESEAVTVMGFTPGTFIPDTLVAADKPELGQVKTFSLHLAPGNNDGKGIGSFKITPRNGAMLIAVGPVGDGSGARLTAGTDENDATVVQMADGTWRAGDPVHGVDVKLGIYVTIAGTSDGRATIDFTTYSPEGATMTEGTLELSTALAAVTGDQSGETPAAFHLAVSPNPTSGFATAQIGLRSASRVTLSIRDMRGAEVARPIDARSLEAGEHAYAIQLDDLAQGTYMMVLDVNGRIESRTLQIVR